MISERTLKDCNIRNMTDVLKKHHCMLHLTTRGKRHEKEMKKSGGQKKKFYKSYHFSVNYETSSCTGDSHVLAIVPIKIKSKKSDKCMQVYVFMNPGSSAT